MRSVALSGVVIEQDFMEYRGILTSSRLPVNITELLDTQNSTSGSSRPAELISEANRLPPGQGGVPGPVAPRPYSSVS